MIRAAAATAGIAPRLHAPDVATGWRILRCRRLWRGCAAVAVLVATAFTVLPAPPAAAHPTLQATTPPAGYSVEESPDAVTLDFGEPVGLVPGPLRLTAADGRQVATSPPALSQSGRRLSARVEEDLGAGVFRVAWQVRGQDGDLVSGGFSFAVGAPVLDGAGSVVATPASGGSAPLNGSAAVLRWVLFAALALGLGGAAGAVLADRIRREVGDDERDPVAVPLLTAAVLGLAATGGLVAVGGFGVAEVVESRPGRLLGIEVVAFAMAGGLGVLARVSGRRWLRAAAAATLMVVVVTEALRAHVSALHPVAGAVLTAVHLLAAAVWIGGLLHVLRVALRWRGAVGWTRLLLFDYARVAIWLVVAVIGTGTLQGLLLVPRATELLVTDYGRVLLAKLAVVVVVIGCAALARRRLRRPLRGAGDSDVRPVGRAVRIELGALVAVLALTGVLTSLTPPVQASAVALPPIPVGPVVPVGTLAGEVTVAATASTGRLVVRLSTPLDGPFDDPPESPPYRLTAKIMPGEELGLASCGTGCFTAPVDWRAGTTTLDLDVTASPWSGGAARLEVAWPPRPASERLDRVLRVMRAEGQFTLHEAVTSNYRGDPGALQALPTTGADFIAREPYAEGAADPVAVPDAGGDQLAFAFPANGITVALWLDGRDRIVRQVLVSPNHLITRTFTYTRSPL